MPSIFLLYTVMRTHMHNTTLAVATTGHYNKLAGQNLSVSSDGAWMPRWRRELARVQAARCRRVSR